MQLKKDGYNLHLINNKDFRTIFVKFVFWNRIKEDEITLRSILFNNLLFSSKSYKSPREMSIKEADLYGASISSRQFRRANYIFNEVSMSITDEKFIGEKLTKYALEFIIDILSNPNAKNNKLVK